jgi:hypothetical protein
LEILSTAAQVVLISYRGLPFRFFQPLSLFLIFLPPSAVLFLIFFFSRVSLFIYLLRLGYFLPCRRSYLPRQLSTSSCLVVSVPHGPPSRGLAQLAWLLRSPLGSISQLANFVAGARSALSHDARWCPARLPLLPARARYPARPALAPSAIPSLLGRHLPWPAAAPWCSSPSSDCARLPAPVAPLCALLQRAPHCARSHELPCLPWPSVQLPRSLLLA